jgi:hypothetical protein
MEERTQIKFKTPDIEGNPIPQLITLEQEDPIEGTSEREDGEQFIWHKWLVTNDQYFMASDSLDGMLKLLPNKVGTVLKIQKVTNPNGGYPFFEINGMNRDKLVTQATVANTQSNIPDFDADPQPMLGTQPATTDSAITRLEQKLDQVIAILHEMTKKEALPF